MAKKMVIEFSANSYKTRSKALKIAVGFSGVHSVALSDKNKSQMEVTGEGVDPVKLTAKLRKKMGKCPYFSCFLPESMLAYVQLVSVSQAKKQEKKEETKPIVWSAPAPPMPYYYCYEDPWRCSIL